MESDMLPISFNPINKILRMMRKEYTYLKTCVVFKNHLIRLQCGLYNFSNINK